MSNTCRMFCRTLASATLICPGIDMTQEKQRDAVSSHLLGFSVRNRKPQTPQQKKICFHDFPKRNSFLKETEGWIWFKEANLGSPTPWEAPTFSKTEATHMLSHSWTSTNPHHPSLPRLRANPASLPGLRGTSGLPPQLLPQLHQDFKAKQPTIGSADRIRTSGNLSKKRLFSFNSK